LPASISCRQATSAKAAVIVKVNAVLSARHNGHYTEAENALFRRVEFMACRSKNLSLSFNKYSRVRITCHCSPGLRVPAEPRRQYPGNNQSMKTSTDYLPASKARRFRQAIQWQACIQLVLAKA
jgi:hypothetical protein